MDVLLFTMLDLTVMAIARLQLRRDSHCHCSVNIRTHTAKISTSQAPTRVPFRHSATQTALMPIPVPMHMDVLPTFLPVLFSSYSKVDT